MSAGPTGRVICGNCRHPRPLHSVSGTPSACQARGCKAGPGGEPCDGFIEATVTHLPVMPMFRAPGVAVRGAAHG